MTRPGKKIIRAKKVGNSFIAEFDKEGALSLDASSFDGSSCHSESQKLRTILKENLIMTNKEKIKRDLSLAFDFAQKIIESPELHGL